LLFPEDSSTTAKEDRYFYALELIDKKLKNSSWKKVKIMGQKLQEEENGKTSLTD